MRRKVTGLEEAGVLLRRGRLLYCAPTGFAAFLTVREALLKLVARGCRLADEIQDARAPVVG